MTYTSSDRPESLHCAEHRSWQMRQASCSKQAARATPEGLRSLQRSTGPFAYRSLCPLSVTTAKSISEVKPSNKRDAHHFSMNGQIWRRFSGRYWKQPGFYVKLDIELAKLCARGIISVSTQRKNLNRIASTEVFVVPPACKVDTSWNCFPYQIRFPRQFWYSLQLKTVAGGKEIVIHIVIQHSVFNTNSRWLFFIFIINIRFTFLCIL